MSETTTSETEIAEAKRNILQILEDDPKFKTSGVLTSHLGGDFKKGDAHKRAFKEVFPTTTITNFIRDYLSDHVEIIKDPSNPIKIYARSPSTVPAEISPSTSTASPSKFPKKLFKLKVFLQSLTEDERKKFSVDGSLLLSILKDEA